MNLTAVKVLILLDGVYSSLARHEVALIICHNHVVLTFKHLMPLSWYGVLRNLEVLVLVVCNLMINVTEVSSLFP